MNGEIQLNIREFQEGLMTCNPRIVNHFLLKMPIRLNKKHPWGYHTGSCDKILRGLASPSDCKLFGKACTPRTPVGPCMVSHEGACKIWHQYHLKKL